MDANEYQRQIAAVWRKLEAHDDRHMETDKALAVIASELREVKIQQSATRDLISETQGESRQLWREIRDDMHTGRIEHAQLIAGKQAEERTKAWLLTLVGGIVGILAALGIQWGGDK